MLSFAAGDGDALGVGEGALLGLGLGEVTADGDRLGDGAAEGDVEGAADVFGAALVEGDVPVLVFWQAIRDKARMRTSRIATILFMFILLKNV
jgi:hypothetical protein